MRRSALVTPRACARWYDEEPSVIHCSAPYQGGLPPDVTSYQRGLPARPCFLSRHPTTPENASLLYMRLLFRPGGVLMDKVLLVESGSRGLAERFLSHLYDVHPAQRVDVLTCYSDEPGNFDGSRGKVINVHEVQGWGGQVGFLSRLAKNRYDVVAILCSNEAIMTPWKWAVGARLPSKLLIVNENADYFWFDTANIGNLRALIKHRWGMHSGISLQLAMQVVVSPFVYAYLLGNAGCVHLRRVLRRA